MIVPVMLLLSLGIVVIYTSNTTLAFQQLGFAVAGMVFYFALRSFDYRSIKPLVKPAYIAILVFLVITAVIGIETRGSARWIPLGPFNFQPSEFAKPVLILALAWFWSQNLPSWKNVLKSLAILLPFVLLIFRQPDLGTALTVSFVWVAMIFAANLSLSKIFLLSLLGSIFAPVGWFGLHDYQKQRIFSFLSPSQDPQGIGFHVIQSMIAVGSGEIHGRGLGRGTQSRLQFLPEFRTDFIFAFIAEELGFIGSILVLSLYSTFFYICFRFFSKIGDKFGELIVVGVVSMMFFQITVNIGMNIGILPVTGITLPLLSYGGSSVITTLISIGLIESVAKFGLKKREIEVFGKD